jgi:pyruvate carboxylase subunit B
MAGAGTTIDRNFDYMNDVRNLVARASRSSTRACTTRWSSRSWACRSVRQGAHAGVLHRHRPADPRERHARRQHLPQGRQRHDGPDDDLPHGVGLKKIMPPEMPLWLHTHDTAGTALTCYLAAIHGGVDGIDLSIRPLAGGTSQPDIRSMAHSAEGHGLLAGHRRAKLAEVESLLERGCRLRVQPDDDDPDARVLGFPMPGGAIGPNVHMMVKAGILDRYGEVLAEFPVVVEAAARGRASRRAASSTGCRRSTTCSTAAGRRSRPATARRCSATSAGRRCRPIRRS